MISMRVLSRRPRPSQFVTLSCLQAVCNVCKLFVASIVLLASCGSNIGGSASALSIEPPVRPRYGSARICTCEVPRHLAIPRRRRGSTELPATQRSPSNSDDTTSTSQRQPTQSVSASTSNRPCRARDLVLSLVEESKCFETSEGARAFGMACDDDVVYDDRYENRPAVGRDNVVRYLRRAKHHPRRQIRIDRISDGDAACGYCWTWVSGDFEGLRGTTFVQLNDATGQIQYVCEIPEPIFKPGDVTKELLQAITRGAEAKPPVPFESKTPTIANEVAKYLYLDLQQAGDKGSMDELMKLLDEGIVYRDFNYPDVMKGKVQVRKFVADFTFPGIEFRPIKFDDGVDSTCFTWEVVLDSVQSDQTIKGISFYELDPATRKISYIRDVPESAIKPPILGKLARDLRPGLGVFEPCPIGSRPGGM